LKGIVSHSGFFANRFLKTENASGLRCRRPLAFVELILSAHPRIGRSVGNRNDLRMLATPGLRQGQACSAASWTAEVAD